MRTIEHWIAGKPTTGVSDRTAPVYNPATGQQQAEVLLGDVSDVEAAIAAASDAFAGLVADLDQQAHQGAVRVPRAGQRPAPRRSPR